MLVKSVHFTHFFTKSLSRSMHIRHPSRHLKSPCGRIPFQQLVINGDRLPGRPHSPNTTIPLASDVILQEPEEMVVRRLGPECRVNGEVSSRSSEPLHAHTSSAGLCVVMSQDGTSLSWTPVTLYTTQFLERLKVMSSIHGFLLCQKLDQNSKIPFLWSQG